jgi:hypothetical protein
VPGILYPLLRLAELAPDASVAIFLPTTIPSMIGDSRRTWRPPSG